MWTYNILLLFILCKYLLGNDEIENPVIYYYGLEESEWSLPECRARQACSALLQRYWRPPALVRLCRCAPRQLRCDAAAAAPDDRLIELNNRAHLQFCQPVTDWPECSIHENALTVVTPYDRMNPDEIEEQHHKGIQLEPPAITFTCRCRSPNYWHFNSSTDNKNIYQCASLPFCMTDEACGNVSNDIYAVYQSCLCPRHHMCVHDGGVAHTQISELLYDGKGWKAYCRRINKEYSYEEY